MECNSFVHAVRQFLNFAGIFHPPPGCTAGSSGDANGTFFIHAKSQARLTRAQLVTYGRAIFDPHGLVARAQGVLTLPLPARRAQWL